MYAISYSKKAIKTLAGMPKNISRRIREKINLLAKDPYSNKQAKGLKGGAAFRLRVADWRIIYMIDDNALEIWVIKVASRGEVYKNG